MPEELSFVVKTMMLHVSAAGTIDYANAAFVQYIGLPKEQVIGAAFDAITRLPGCEIFKGVALPGAKEKKQYNGTSADGRVFEMKAIGVGGGADITITEKTEIEQLRAYVGRYVQKGLSDLTDDEKSTFAIPERRFMSVSFTDLRGFTAMSEKMRPEEVRETINAYLEAVMKAVEDNNGTIDKIVGDEVMALFGAPRHYKDHALRAVKTALDQVRNLRALQEEYLKHGKVMPACGIGINTGEMVVGNIGSEARMNYTVLGSSVNLAARLCGAAQGLQVICTQATLKEIMDNLPEGWNVHSPHPPAPSPLSQGSERGEGERVQSLGEKTEGVFDLPEELRGVVVSIGPKDSPLYQFRYLYAVKVKGVDDPLPVIEAVSVADESAMKFTVKEFLSDEKAASTEKVFGKYRLIERIGKGGMAEVWKARDMFGNDVAVKMLLAGEGATSEQLHRFMREAEVMKLLDHRNVCRVVDVGQYEGISYIAMELLPGVTLGDLAGSSIAHKDGDTIDTMVSRVEAGRHSPQPPSPLPLSPRDVREGKGVGSKKSEPWEGHAPRTAQLARATDGDSRDGVSVCALPVTHALAIFDGICAGVEFAHEKGIIHRDLKPANVMIKRNGDPVVMDFGLARFERGEGDLTMTQQVVGTIDYMAPEQAELAKKADERSDIFSLGAILYYVLTGEKWFTSSGNILSDIGSLRDKSVVSPRSINGKVPKDLETIVLKALEKDPVRRYQSVKEMRADIARFRADEPIHARPPSVMYIVSKKMQKHKAIIIPSVAAVLIGVVALFIFYGERLKEAFTWKYEFTETFNGGPLDYTNRWYEVFNRERAFDPLKRNAIEHIGMQSNGVFRFSGVLGMEQLQSIATVHGSFRAVFDVQFKRCGVFQLLIENADTNTQERYAVYNISSTPSDVYFTKNGVMLDTAVLGSYLKLDRRYSLVMEKDGNTVRMYIDGKRIIEFYDQDTIPGAGDYRVSIAGKEGEVIDIHAVRVYSMGLPEKTGTIIAADTLYRLGYYSNAAVEYGSIASQYSGEMSERAEFQIAMSRLRGGDANAAERSFEQYTRKHPKSFYAAYALYERGKIHLDLGDTNEANAIFEQIAKYQHHPACKLVMYQITKQYMNVFNGYRSGARDEKLFSQFENARVAIRRWESILHVSGRNNSFLRRAAEFLQAAGMYDDVIKKYPDQRHQVAWTLYRLGRYDDILKYYPEQRAVCSFTFHTLGRRKEIVDKYPDQRIECASAYRQMGQPERVLREYPDQRFHCALALTELGRNDEVLRNYSDQRYPCARALNRLGRYDEVFRDYSDQREQCAAALKMQGKFKDIVDKYPDQRWYCANAMIALGRFDELLTKYHDQKRICQYAILALGDYQSTLSNCMGQYDCHAIALLYTKQFTNILSNYSDQREKCARTYLHLGEYAYVLSNYTEQREKCSLALTALGDYSGAVSNYPYENDAVYFARSLRALARYIDGDRLSAFEEFSSLSKEAIDYNRWMMHHQFSHFLLPGYLRFMSDRDTVLAKEYKRIFTDHSNAWGGELAISAAYLAGKTNEAAMEDLMRAHYIPTRIALLKGMRLEYVRKPKDALPFYREYAAYTQPEREFDPAMDKFVAWRIRILSGK
ncbi:MAG: protein kinase [Spirochaetota bacterium]